MHPIPVFEANGQVVRSYFDAFRLVPHVPRNIFAKRGIGRILPSGEFELDTQRSYPLSLILDALSELTAIAGAKKTFEMGVEIVKNATVPPGANDIFSAMQIFDAGYHLNHRVGGTPMFDTHTGVMSEGIGHYRYVSGEGTSIWMDVDAPYPCDLDRGIMQAWACRFQKGAIVEHKEPTQCRKTGARACRYEIKWK